MIHLATWQKELTINDRKFTFSELLAFSHSKIESQDTPPWETEIYRFIIAWSDDTDHIMQYSSGTTGKSKEIRLSKQSMMTSARITCQFFNLKKGHTALLCLPVDYIAGKMMIVRSLVGSLNLCLTEPKSNPYLSEMKAIEFCAMVPLQVLNLMNSRNDLHCIKNLIIGGAEVSPELENMLLQTGTNAYATYGMAETCSHVALRKLNGPDRQHVYQALPDVVLTHDERDCMVISAPWLPARIITNDIVQFTGQGAFRWLGRFDNLINSGGIKIVPEETEVLITDKTGIECALIGFPDEILGQRLILVAEKHKTTIKESFIKEELQKLLPHKLLPKEIIWVDKFPRNNAFKLDRLKLTEMIYRRL